VPFARELFAADRYTTTTSTSMVMGVQMPIALRRMGPTPASAWSWGSAARKPPSMRDVLAQRYRVQPHSFGYPACRTWADSRPQLDLAGERPHRPSDG